MIQTIALITPIYVSGLWTLVFLIARPSDNHARFFLGYFMLGAFLIHLGLAFHLWGDFTTFLRFEPFYNLALFMVFPMYYLYIRLLTADLIPKYKYLYHYIPALIIMITTFYFNSGNSSLRESYYIPANTSEVIFFKRSFKNMERPEAVFHFLIQLILVAQIIFYSRRSILLFRVHHRRILSFYSTESAGKIQWVRISYYTLLMTSITAVINAFLGKDMLHMSQVYLLSSSITSSSIEFIIGYLGNRQVQVVKELDDKHTEENPESDNKTTQDDIELKQKIEWAFTIKKLHCYPELSIWDVSGELNTNRTYVSNFINRYYGVNFSRFVNQYRVEESKIMLMDPESRKFSLETIGEKCGFGSLNNFIRVFQSFEGVTPGNFRKSQVIKDLPANPGHAG